MSFWKRLFGIKDAQSAKPPATGHQTSPTPPQQAAAPKAEKNVMAEVEKANEILAMSGERIEAPSGSSDQDILLLILSAYKRVMNRDVSPNDTPAIRRAQLQVDRANAHLMQLMTQIRR